MPVCTGSELMRNLAQMPTCVVKYKRYGQLVTQLWQTEFYDLEIPWFA